MKDYRHCRLELMTARQVAAYLETNDLAILPVGCTEMHGPLLPLGTDTLQDTAMAWMLADQWQALCLPTIPYVYTGASERWPGTISISPEDSIRYVQAVAMSALEAGFSRLVICASHGPMGFMAETLIRSIFRQTEEIVLFLSPYGKIMEAEREEFGRGSEDLNTLGAVKFLGLEGCFDPHADRDEPPTFNFDSMARIKSVGGRVPWIFSKNHQHVGLRSDITLADADRSIACMERAAEAMKDLPSWFADYQKSMRELLDEPPWSREDAWCY